MIKTTSRLLKNEREKNRIMLKIIWTRKKSFWFK